jgi:hypothetical protein
MFTVRASGSTPGAATMTVSSLFGAEATAGAGLAVVALPPTSFRVQRDPNLPSAQLFTLGTDLGKGVHNAKIRPRPAHSQITTG